MPTTTTQNSTYAGEAAAKYVSAALLSSVTLENGGVDVIPNIKFRRTLRPANIGDIIKDATCDFNATGNVELLERKLEPKELQVNEELCKDTFQKDWDAISMGFSAHDVIPKNFNDFIIAENSAQVAESNEINIWRGNSANSGEYDGFTTLIKSDPDLPAAQEITGTTVTAANVITELGKVADAVPARLYGREDLNIYVSQNIFRAYKRALGGFAAQGKGAAGVGNNGPNQDINVLFFDGIKVFMANGLAQNTMIATRKSNLKFGTGLLNDHSEVKVLDMADTDGSQNVRFVMRFTAGVQYEFAKDFVTYGISNTVN